MKNAFGTSLILLLAFLECGVCAQPNEPLFSVPPDRIQVDLPSINPSVVLRQRLVTVQSDLLGRGDEPIVFLNPFDDVQLEAAWERTDKNANGSFTWFGTIGEAPSSEVVLVWDGSKMAASITMMNRKYTVRHLKDDLHLVRELDLTVFQPASLAFRSGSFALEAAPSSLETDVLVLVNQERAAQNLKPLTWDSQLHEAARNHSEDMAANNYFSHTSLDGRTLVDRIEDAGYHWNAAGENIAAGYSTPQAVVNGWMNSAGHRQNILNSSYCDLGVGYAFDQSSTYDHYWTQDFGRRTGVTVCPSVVNQPPSASFMATPLSGLPSLVVQFDASGSVDPEGGLLSFYWNFGDGQSGSGKIAAHTYTEAGLYTVTLTVTDSGGASDTFVRVNYIEIETPPGEGVCDELLGDFGSAYGLWHFDRVGGWQQINSGNPGLMVAVDIDNDQQEELVATFPGYGLHSYDPIAGWTLLNVVSPNAMASANLFE